MMRHIHHHRTLNPTSEFENGSVYLVQYLYVVYIHHEEGVVCVVGKGIST